MNGRERGKSVTDTMGRGTKGMGGRMRWKRTAGLEKVFLGAGVIVLM